MGISLMDTQHTLTVVLDLGISEDEADNLVTAIGLFSGVSSVDFNLLEEVDKLEQARARAEDWFMLNVQRNSGVEVE